MRVGSDPMSEIVLDGPEVPACAATLEVDDGGRPWVKEGRDGAGRALGAGERFEVGAFALWFEAAAKGTGESTRQLGAAPADSGGLRLEVPTGPVVLEPGSPSTLGRSDANDITIDADVISGHHCELEARDGAWHIRDLGSTNGTFLDGVRVERARLPAKGTIVLGDLEVRFGPAQPEEPVDEFYGLVGQSPAMQAVFRQVEVVARLDEPVLILGETGTGKELVASALHAASPRAKKRFLARNCGAIPDTLADAELFGSQKGAFSGAVDKAGVFEGAAGGTVFLDEVGELPVSVQPKLLRALQEKKVQRLGALAEKPVDFRLVGATHRDLAAMAAQGRFREDLFHRLGVFELRLPPLRERREDIPRLAEHLLDGAGVVLTASACDRLMSHDWPGNVRELRNCLIRASAFRTGDRIDADDLDLPRRGASTSGAGASARRKSRKGHSLDDAAIRAETLRVWEACGRSVSKAAQELGIAKSTMHRRKEVYRLPDPSS